MEGSNYWGYSYKTQHSNPRSRLITWRSPEVKFGRNVVKKKQHKNYEDEDKKSAINKNKTNSQIKKPHLKMIPIKDNWQNMFTNHIHLIYMHKDLIYHKTKRNQTNQLISIVKKCWFLCKKSSRRCNFCISILVFILQSTHSRLF